MVSAPEVRRNGMTTHPCFAGSSKGRGSRAAGWFNDLISDHNISNISSMILLDGIAGWAKAGEDYSRIMDEYDPEVWGKSK